MLVPSIVPQGPRAGKMADLPGLWDPELSCSLNKTLVRVGT
jgi:hypothetical protein